LKLLTQNQAKELGASHTLNSSEKNFIDQLLKANKGDKFDICIDNTGLPEIL